MAKLLTFCPTIYSYPIFNFTVHHYVFFMTREISRNINSVANISSLSLSLSHCEIQIQFSSREYFHYIFFPFSINVNVLSPRVQFLFIFFFFSSFTPRLFCPYVTTINYPVRSFEKCTVHMLRIRRIVLVSRLFKHVPRDRAYS